MMPTYLPREPSKRYNDLYKSEELRYQPVFPHPPSNLVDNRSIESIINSALSQSYRSMEEPNPNVINYALANAAYHISASQGYLAEFDVSYLSLTLEREEEKHSYIILFNGEHEIKFLEKRLERLLERVTLKKRVEKRDIREIPDKNAVVIELREMPKKMAIPAEKNKISLYSNPLIGYKAKRERSKTDFTNLVPAKFVTKLPKSVMGGVLGYTFLGENMMAIRDDLYGAALNEVEIHEAIHTDDEYETRVITRWMLDNDTVYH